MIRSSGSKFKRALAKSLNSDKSPPEKMLWSKLCRKQLGVNFYTQKPLFGYVADFWCPERQLVVEVDGMQHYTPAARLYDARRDLVMRQKGIRVIRIPARVIFANLNFAVQMIQSAI